MPLPKDRTPGNYYVAERAKWTGDVRMIRTDHDRSAVIGVTNDRDALLFAAAGALYDALYQLLQNLADADADRHEETGKYLDDCLAGWQAIYQADGLKLPDEELSNA